MIVPKIPFAMSCLINFYSFSDIRKKKNSSDPDIAWNFYEWYKSPTLILLWFLCLPFSLFYAFLLWIYDISGHHRKIGTKMKIIDKEKTEIYYKLRLEELRKLRYPEKSEDEKSDIVYGVLLPYVIELNAEEDIEKFLLQVEEIHESFCMIKAIKKKDRYIFMASVLDDYREGLLDNDEFTLIKRGGFKLSTFNRIMDSLKNCIANCYVLFKERNNLEYYEVNLWVDDIRTMLKCVYVTHVGKKHVRYKNRIKLVIYDSHICRVFDDDIEFKVERSLWGNKKKLITDEVLVGSP